MSDDESSAVRSDEVRVTATDVAAAVAAVAERLRPQVAAFVNSVQEAIAVHEPAIRRFLEGMARAQETMRYWDEHAPAALKDALGTEGLIVPSSQISLPDMIELLEICESRGSAAAVVWVRGAYDQIFADPVFLARLEADWSTDVLLTRRLPVLHDALRAHAAGLYGASVPALIAQFEGIVADLANHTGQMNFNQLRDYVKQRSARAPWTAGVMQSFVGSTLLTKFGHGDAAPRFSRHAILHGGDVSYGTEQNSRTAILLIDFVRSLREEDGIHASGTGAAGGV